MNIYRRKPLCLVKNIALLLAFIDDWINCVKNVKSSQDLQDPLGNGASNYEHFVVFLKASFIRSIRHYHKIELDVPRLRYYWSVT